MLTVTPDQLIVRIHDILARVAGGEEVAIVDHGRAVARLVGDRARLRERLAGAVATHDVELGSDDHEPAPTPAAIGGTAASVLLGRDRQSRDDVIGQRG